MTSSNFSRFCDLEVARLDLLLRLLERLVDPWVDDRLVLLQAELPSMLSMRSEPKMRMRSSSSDNRTGAARVALAAGAAAQLIVDPPRSVALGAEHVQPAGRDHVLLLRGHFLLDRAARRVLRLVLDAGELLRLAHLEIAPELDIGTAPGHVGRDGHAAKTPRLGDDERLLLVDNGRSGPAGSSPS